MLESLSSFFGRIAGQQDAAGFFYGGINHAKKISENTMLVSHLHKRGYQSAYYVDNKTSAPIRNSFGDPVVSFISPTGHHLIRHKGVKHDAAAKAEWKQFASDISDFHAHEIQAKFYSLRTRLHYTM